MPLTPCKGNQTKWSKSTDDTDMWPELQACSVPAAILLVFLRFDAMPGVASHANCPVLAGRVMPTIAPIC